MKSYLEKNKMNPEELENEINDTRQQIARIKEWVGFLFIFVLAAIVFGSCVVAFDTKK